MKKSNEKANILIWSLIAFNIIVTGVLYSTLPQMIPTHWGIQGNIDGWSPKMPFAFFTSGISIIMVIMFELMPKIDPKGENYKKFKGQYEMLKLFLIIIFTVIQAVTITSALHIYVIQVDLVIKLMIGIMFIIIGNAMPKFKHNYFVGIRTPWTLFDEKVWTRTHRHGGFLWFVSGIIMSIVAFIPGEISAFIYFVIIATVSFEPIAYSYLIQKRG